MKSTLITPTELTDELTGSWASWHRDAGVPQNPFLTSAFAVAYGTHQRRARVAVIEDGSQVVGLVPLELSGRSVARVLAFGLSDMQAPAFRPGFGVDCHGIMRASGLAVIEFDRYLPQATGAMTPKSAKALASPVVDLSDGFDAWIAEKRRTSSSRFRRVAQYERKLGREEGEVAFDFASTSHADLDLLMQWKSAQFIRTGRRDRFACKWFRDLLHDLLDRREGFGGVLSKLTVDGRTIALDFGIRNGTAMAGWFPAYDVSMSRYSPGTITLLKQVEGAATNGITRMDLGPGEADYKESFKNYDDFVYEGWCERPVPAAVVRRAAKMPERIAMDFVLSSPRLRRAARSTLSAIGSVRHSAVRISRRSSAKAWVAAPGLFSEFSTSFPFTL